jgi:hypothetical protein
VSCKGSVLEVESGFTTAVSTGVVSWFSCAGFEVQEKTVIRTAMVIIERILCFIMNDVKFGLYQKQAIG